MFLYYKVKFQGKPGKVTCMCLLEHGANSRSHSQQLTSSSGSVAMSPKSGILAPWGRQVSGGLLFIQSQARQQKRTPISKILYNKGLMEWLK
jgi:hypothetical protein